MTQSALPLKCFHNVLKTRTMYPQGRSIGFCNFYSGFFLPFRSQTLVNCTSLDSLRCVVYFYNRFIISATSKHLERNKCWKVRCSYLYLNRPVASPFTPLLWLTARCFAAIFNTSLTKKLRTSMWWLENDTCSSCTTSQKGGHGPTT